MSPTTFECEFRGARARSGGVRRFMALVAVCLALSAACGDDDEKSSDESSSSVSVSGKWLYRSFYNDNDEFVRASADPPATALSLLWAEGIMTLEEDAHGAVTGSMVFAAGVALDLSGEVVEEGSDGQRMLKVEGVGVAGTLTATWKYSIEGWFVKDWEVGDEEQRPSIVGSVVNSVAIAGDPPIGAALGTVGSFMLVKQDEAE